MGEPIKVLIPAAGYGKRMAALSGKGHKELLPLGPMTMIEHCLDMVLASGLEQIAIVIRPDKEDVRRVCENFWRQRGRRPGSLRFLYQDPPRGVADAMRMGADFAGTSPLAVIMPDAILLHGPPLMAQMMLAFERCRENIIGVIPFPPERSGQFGSVGLITLAPAADGLPPKVIGFSPKAPGLLDVPGRGRFYKGHQAVIFLPGWASGIENLKPNHEGELDDTDMVMDLVKNGRLRAAVLNGTGYDLGNPIGFREAEADFIREPQDAI